MLSTIVFSILICTAYHECELYQRLSKTIFSIIFWGSWEIFHIFLVVFQASTGKKLWKKHYGIFWGKFDAKHSVIIAILFVRGQTPGSKILTQAL